jgi:hypothetical protein
MQLMHVLSAYRGLYIYACQCIGSGCVESLYPILSARQSWLCYSVAVLLCVPQTLPVSVERLVPWVDESDKHQP